MADPCKESEQISSTSDRYSLLASITTDGYVACWAVLGSFDSVEFYDFIAKQVVCAYPTMSQVLLTVYWHFSRSWKWTHTLGIVAYLSLTTAGSITMLHWLILSTLLVMIHNWWLHLEADNNYMIRLSSSVSTTIFPWPEPHRRVVQYLYGCLFFCLIIRSLSSYVVKAFLWQHGYEFWENDNPEGALMEACGCITGEMAKVWFRHAGYMWNR